MNMNIAIDSSSCGMWTSEDTTVPLEGIRVDAELALPVAITRQSQRYRNTLNSAIEARYVFPVPLDAILLGLEIRIGERLLHGVVKPRGDAERDYETAIVQGDSAFLLTRLDDGLYQISLGNILPKEQVTLTVTWAETLRWSGQEIRYRLPNLVGPHYGNPQHAGIAPEDAPWNSGAAAYEFDLAVLLRGDLSAATLSCPGHQIRQVTQPDGRLVQLDSSDWLDRSFTLVMQAATPPALVAWSASDGDDVAVMASCYPPVAASNYQPHHVTLLIDGSGSMEGISIDQARTAAIEIVQTLRDDDFCSLAAFGSETVLLTRQPLRVGQHRQQLLSLCQRLNANLGGTEMQKALNSVMGVTPEGGDILMITDGQAYFSDPDIQQFARHRRRLFTIGVGHSTSEKVLRQLSEASGGFCELVNPNEDMASHVLSHFRRLRAPRIMPTYIFHGTVLRQDAPPVVFGGDTAIVSARLKRLEKRTLQVNMAQADLRAEIVPAQGMLATLLPRLVAYHLLPTDNIKQAKAEAVHYQLVTEHTSMIAVLERDRRNSDAELPVIIDIPQMDVDALMSVPSLARFSVSVRSDQVLYQSDALTTNRSLTSLGLVNSASTIDTTWLIQLNTRIAGGEPLQNMLMPSSLPLSWQSIVAELLEQWPEDWVVLAAITASLHLLTLAQHRQCRALARAVTHLRGTLPGIEPLMAEVEEMAPSIAED
jgi:Ca-activated chloride channel family protein